MKMQHEEHVSDSENISTTTFVPEDSASVCEDSRDDSIDYEFEEDNLSDAGSESNDSLDALNGEESDAAFSSRVKDAESRFTNMVQLSIQLEQRVSRALKERQAANTMRLKLLYRNLAAAVLGRLTARSRATLDRYNNLCLSYLRKLLLLQNRETVTNTTRTILRHLQRRLRQEAPHFRHQEDLGFGKVSKWLGVSCYK